MLYPNEAGTVSKGSPTSTGYTCRINGTVYAQSIELELVTRESCCERTIVGPHADVTPNVYYSAPWNVPGLIGPFPPADGVAFSNYKTTLQRPIPSQRTQVLDRLQFTGVPPFNVLLPFWLSDMYRPGPKTDALQALETEACGGILETDDPNDPCAAQVDHIIPRVDVYGCKCGSNSFSNALLISRALNIKMSNNCSDETRNAILDAFDPTVPPPGTTASTAGLRGMRLADSGKCTKPSVWAL